MSAQDQAFTNLINAIRQFLGEYINEYRNIAVTIAVTDYASWKTCLDLGITDAMICDRFWAEVLKSSDVVRINYEIDEKKLRELVEMYRYISEWV